VALYHLFSLLSVFLGLSLCVFFLTKRRRNGWAEFLSLNLVLIAWQLGKFLLNVENIENKGFWAFVSFVGATGVYPIFYRLFRKIAMARSKLVMEVEVFCWISALFFILCEASGVLTKGYRETSLGLYHIPDTLYYVYVFVYAGTMILALNLLLPIRFRSKGELYYQSWAVFLSGAIGYFMGVLEFYNILRSPIFMLPNLSPLIWGLLLYGSIFRFNLWDVRWSLRLVVIESVRWLGVPLIIFLSILAKNWSIERYPALYHPWGIFFQSVILAVWILLLIHVLEKRKGKMLIGVDSRSRFLGNLKKELHVSMSLGSIALKLEEHLKEYDQLDLVNLVIYEFRIGHPARSDWIYKPVSNKLLRPHSTIPTTSLNELIWNLRMRELSSKEKNQTLSKIRFLRRNHLIWEVPLQLEDRVFGTMFLRCGKMSLGRLESHSVLLQEVSGLVSEVLAQKKILFDYSRSEHLSKAGELTATLAHEIKNPLGSLYSALQLLAEEHKDSVLASMMLEDVQRLQELVEQFLAFARPFIVNKTEVKIVNWLGKWQQKSDPHGEQTLLKMDVSTDFIIHTDARAMEHIITNLWQNACRHKSSSKVRMHLGLEEHVWFIDVIDDGEGISPSKLDMLFEPFFTTSAQGTGLGLAFSYKLALQLDLNLKYMRLMHTEMNKEVTVFRLSGGV
jgi:signal transduction histidine kinase